MTYYPLEDVHSVEQDWQTMPRAAFYRKHLVRMKIELAVLKNMQSGTLNKATAELVQTAISRTLWQIECSKRDLEIVLQQQTAPSTDTIQ